MPDLDSRLKHALQDIAQFAPEEPQARVARPPARRAPLLASLAVLATAVAIPLGLSQLPPGPSVPPASSPNQEAPATTNASTATRDEVTDVEQAAMSAFQGAPGFGKVTVDYDKGSVTLAWSGDVPGNVRDFVDAEHGRVLVTLIRVDYSLRELKDAITRISAARVDLGLPEGTVYLPNETLSGVVVETLASWDGTAADVTRVAGVPAHVVIVADPPELIHG